MSKYQGGASALLFPSLQTPLLLTHIMHVFFPVPIFIFWGWMRRTFESSEINFVAHLHLNTILITLTPTPTQSSFYLHRLLSMSVLRSTALFRTSAVSVWLFIGAVRRWLLGRISESRRWNWWSYPLDTSWGGDQASSDSSFVRMTDNLSIADFGTTVVHHTYREDKTTWPDPLIWRSLIRNLG